MLDANSVCGTLRVFYAYLIVNDYVCVTVDSFIYLVILFILLDTFAVEVVL